MVVPASSRGVAPSAGAMRRQASSSQTNLTTQQGAPATLAPAVVMRSSSKMFVQQGQLPRSPAAASLGAGASPVPSSSTSVLQASSPVPSSSTGSGTIPNPVCSISSSSTMATRTRSHEDDGLTDEMRALLRKIDADGSGTISEMELLAAAKACPEVAALLQGVEAGDAMADEERMDVISDLFEKIAGGKPRVRYAEFVAHCSRMASTTTANLDELRGIFEQIDADGNKTVSKLELFNAVERNPEVARFIMPKANFGRVLSDENAFAAVKQVFQQVARGKTCFDFADFERHFGQHAQSTNTVMKAVSHTLTDRSSQRVLVIGPGFGRGLHPRQGASVEAAGYASVHWCEGIPLPDGQASLATLAPHLETLRRHIEELQPDVVACASKGGIYMVGLWAKGYWRGPSVLINAHPACGQHLPEGVPVVLCHGSNDELYQLPRCKLEALISTGASNRCFLYFTGNSGQLPTGQRTRVGDRHHMESLLSHDCLPRLLDAAMSHEGPELNFMRTWKARVTEERLNAERWLGYSPDVVRKRWTSTPGSQADGRRLFEVPPDSEEFRHVATAFGAQPREPPVYLLSPPATWEVVKVLKVERIENASQFDGCARPYYEAIERSVIDQGVEFEPGVHTSWAFHGASEAAIDSIVNASVAGFVPLAAGTRGATLWGHGTYFARDAKYVADGGFCGKPSPDGTRRMMMCLLTTGIPCVGDPEHYGMLPLRRKPHRYHSSVDSMSSPEIFITQHSGAAQAAYLLTFK